MLDKSLPLLLEHCAVSKRERIWRNLTVDEKIAIRGGITTLDLALTGINTKISGRSSFDVWPPGALAQFALRGNSAHVAPPRTSVFKSLQLE